MNWIKIFHLKNQEEVAINITNKSFKEVIDEINEELQCEFTLGAENKSTIYAININEISYLEVRCTNGK